MEEPEVVRDLKRRLREAMGDEHSSEIDLEDHAQRITDTVLEARIAHITKQVDHHRRWRKEDR